MNSYIYFLLNCVDSFYSKLPANSSIEFKISENEDIILPKLTISLVVYSDKKIFIRKISNYTLMYKVDLFNTVQENSYAIPLNEIPSWFRLRAEMVCGRVAILYQKNKNIFEGHYYQDCCNSVFGGHLLKDKIARAFEIIKVNHNVLYEKLVSSIDYIVPHGNSLEKKYVNFAIATLKKTIFLSINLLLEDDIHIAECIVHEYSHCELHVIQDTILLTNIENNILDIYSPWRKDARHLLGLVHAIYIAHEVELFYFSYVQNKNNSYESLLLVTKKIEVIVHQIYIAIRQIKRQHLTNFSLSLIDTILESTQAISKQLSMSTSQLPEEVINHIKMWRLANSGLTIVE